jgi:hypothetical protein
MVELLVSLLGGGIVALVLERAYKHWRADAADYELWISAEDLPLTAEDNDRFETGLQYLVDGEIVRSPYVATIDIWNAGAKDIRSDMFDDGRPIQIAINVPIVKELKGSRAFAADASDFALNPDGLVRIEPSLIKAGMLKSYRLLTDGKPELTWESPVADLHVFDLDQEWTVSTPDRKIARLGARVVAIAGFTLFALLMLASLFMPEGARQVVADTVTPYAPWFSLIGLIIPIWFVLWSYGTNASRRPRQAAKARRLASSLAPKTSSESLVRYVPKEYVDALRFK